MNDSLQPPYILLAENDLLARGILERHFTSAGWRFDSVPDGLSAVNALREHLYDVIVTDCVLPDLNGVELLRRIREQRPSQAIIVVSAKYGIEDAVTVLREGVTDYLRKPVDFLSLEQAVRRVVNGSRRRELIERLNRFVQTHHATYCLTSGELAESKVSLPIVDSLFRGGRITIETKIALDVAFQEALTNSVEHGNLELDSKLKDEFDHEGLDKYSQLKRERLLRESYATRKVTIFSDFDGVDLIIRIQDQGRGFLWSKEGAGKTSPDLLSCHGRGTSIIEKTMDQVEYRNGGTEIVMIKHIRKP